MDLEETFEIFMDNWELIVSLLMFGFFIGWAILYMINPSDENLDKGAKLIEKDATPNWLNPIDKLKDSNNPLVVVLIIVFFILVVRYYNRKNASKSN